MSRDPAEAAAFTALVDTFTPGQARLMHHWLGLDFAEQQRHVDRMARLERVFGACFGALAVIALMVVLAAALAGAAPAPAAPAPVPCSAPSRGPVGVLPEGS